MTDRDRRSAEIPCRLSRPPQDAPNAEIEAIAEREYEYGFETEIETDFAPKGLNEEIVRFISAKKEEPEWLLEWRLKALKRFQEMLANHGRSRTWAQVSYPKIDYQDMYYYAAPKSAPEYESLDEVDPRARLDLREARHPARGAEATLAGVKRSRSTRSSTRSPSPPPSRRAREARHHLLLLLRGGEGAPELVRKYLGSVVPYSDNFFAALNSAVFTDGSFAYIPKGVRCPMELSTYFRINAARHRPVRAHADRRRRGRERVSYLEGCTAPMRDENQLHAAVVELVALDDAEIKYSTVQNWYPGDKDGKSAASTTS